MKSSSFSGNKKISRMKRKPATRVFQHFSFRRHDHAEPIRRSVVTRPKVKGAKQEKCDSRLFAIIRGGISHASAPNHTFPEFNPHQHRVSSIPLINHVSKGSWIFLFT